MTNWVWTGAAYNSSNDPSWLNPDNWQGDVVPTIDSGDTVTLAPVGYVLYGGGGFENVSSVASLSGTLDNQGTISLLQYNYTAQAGYHYYGFAISLSGNTTLTGGGTIVLSGSPVYSGITGTLSSNTAPTLENVDNTIEGSGVIGGELIAGASSLDIINDSKGLSSRPAPRCRLSSTARMSPIPG